MEREEYIDGAIVVIGKTGVSSMKAISHELAEVSLKEPYCKTPEVKNYLKLVWIERQFHSYRQFVTSKKRVIEREEALLIAKAAGQMKSWKEMDFMCRFARIFFRKLLFSQMINFEKKTEVE